MSAIPYGFEVCEIIGWETTPQYDVLLATVRLVSIFTLLDPGEIVVPIHYNDPDPHLRSLVRARTLTVKNRRKVTRKAGILSVLRGNVVLLPVIPAGKVECDICNEVFIVFVCLLIY